jgi:hypothetical protein
MSNAYEEILDFITSSPSLNEILDFEHSLETLKRVDYLISVADKETITEEERDELREFYRANELIEQLKVRARRRLGIEEDEA